MTCVWRFWRWLLSRLFPTLNSEFAPETTGGGGDRIWITQPRAQCLKELCTAPLPQNAFSVVMRHSPFHSKEEEEFLTLAPLTRIPHEKPFFIHFSFAWKLLSTLLEQRKHTECARNSFENENHSRGAQICCQNLIPYTYCMYINKPNHPLSANICTNQLLCWT